MSSFSLPRQISDKLDALSDKDRRALVLLATFVLAMLLYGVFALHVSASKAEKNALETQSTLFWLRAQAPLVAQQNPVSTESIEQIIEDRAASQGVSVTVAANSGRAQINAMHSNASVLGNFFAALAVDGLEIEQMSLTQQSDQDILAEATLTKGS